MDFPVSMISSFTIPSPSILIEREYFLFSKFAVIVWSEFIVIVNGFSFDSMPDQPVKTYSLSGVAVIVTLEPDS